MAQVLRPVGERVELVVGRERNALLHCNAGVGTRGGDYVVVGHQEPVRAAGAQAVPNAPFPQDALEVARRVVGVFSVLAYALHARRADDHTASAFGERSLLRVEEAEGGSGLQRAEERVQHDELVGLVLDPAGLEGEVGFAFRLVAQAQRRRLSDLA